MIADPGCRKNFCEHAVHQNCKLGKRLGDDLLRGSAAVLGEFHYAGRKCGDFDVRVRRGIKKPGNSNVPAQAGVFAERLRQGRPLF